ncbi:MAG: ROK family protein, partial [Pseudomonadota bacterium]
MSSHVIGIDVGGTMIKGALFDSRGALINKDSLPTMADQGKDAFIKNAVTLIAALSGQGTKVSAVGLGLAGVIDKERSMLCESPNLPLLQDFPVRKLLESALSIPVFLENDANCAALGELWAGAGKGLENFLFFTVGTGIGSGLILNGRLWAGEQGKA